MDLTHIPRRMVILLYMIIALCVGSWFMRHHLHAQYAIELEKRDAYMRALLSCVNEGGFRFEYGWAEAIEVTCKRSKEWKESTFIDYNKSKGRK